MFCFSIVTSLTNIEAVDKIQISHSPKKQADSSELELKVVTPKRALDLNIKTEITLVKPDKQSLVDNEKNSTNNNSKSPFLAVGKQTKDIQAKEEDMTAKLYQNGFENNSDNNSETDSINNESLKPNNHLIGNKNDNVLKSVSEDSVHEISITECEKSKPSGSFINTATPTANKSTVKVGQNFLKSSEEIDYSMENLPLAQQKLLTPQKTSQKDKLMLSVKRNSRKKTNPDRVNSMKATNASPSNKESQFSSNGTPKISPRRLRKRKSGVTPILSSSKSIKKNKLSLTRNSTGKTTPQTSLIEVIQIDEDDDMITDIEKNKELPIVKQKSSVSEVTLLSAKLENTNSALDKNETSKSEKENINVQNKTESPIKKIIFSPVKIVLSRIPIDQLTGVQCNFEKKIDTSFNLLKANQKKESLSSIICSNTKKILTDDCEDHLESSMKNLNSDATIDKMHTNPQLEAQKQIVATKSKKIPPTVVASPENERHNSSLSDKIVEETKATVTNVRTKLMESTDTSLNKSENLSSSFNVSNKLKVSILPTEDKEHNPETCNISNSSPIATRSSELMRLSLANSKITDDSIDKDDSQIYPSGLDEKSQSSKRSMSNTVKTRPMDDKLSRQIAADLSNSCNEISTIGNTISKEENLSEQNLLEEVSNSLSEFSTENHLLPFLKHSNKSNEEIQTEVVKEIQSTQQGSTSKYDRSVNYEETDKNTCKNIDFISKTGSYKNDRGKVCEKRAIEDVNISAAGSSKLANFSVVKDATEISLRYEETILEEKLLSNKKNSQSSLKLNPTIFETKSCSNFDSKINVKNSDTIKKTSPKKPINNEKSYTCQLSSNMRHSDKILQEDIENNILQSNKADEEFPLKINDVEDTTDLLCKQTSLPKSPERSETNVEKSVQQNLNLHVSTPIKSGQKNLKQTQLPFTPIRKFSDSHAGSPNKALPADDSNKSKVLLLKPEDEVHSPFLVLEKINLSKYMNKSCSSSHKDDVRDLCEVENKVEIVHELKQQPSTSDVEYKNRQEVPRTPEKPVTSKVDYCTDGKEIGPSDEVIMESPMQLTESEDIIASSQENDLLTRSCIISDRASLSCTKSPLKILRESPKKVENTLLNQLSINCSERVLRSSPLKISPRSNSTPIKKSVCRRLDVEIDENIPSTNEPNNSVHRLRSPSSLTVKNTNKIEYSFKELEKSSSDNLLQMKPSSETNKVDDLKISSNINSTDYANLESQLIESSENAHASSSKLCQMESYVDLIESPIRTLRFDGADSPKSPSSRTNQMMELAMQEKEKTVSSPATNLIKKRRVLPVRLGPIAKTPKSQRYTNILYL